jgi:2-polyprenyl-3-methyl-5-hydroxy-6-metoxy-1,4-benzoquinol methylase
MNIDSRFDPFLQGIAFDNELGFAAVPARRSQDVLRDRITCLIELCRGKRVLHLGCCDHPPLVCAKLEQGTWLHKPLTEASAVCLGVDIDPLAVEFVRRTTGFDNVVLADLAAAIPDAVQQGSPWEMVVAGEIVEHLDSPVDFLSRLHRNLAPHCREILISVPNAFSLRNFLNGLQGVEKINTDHRYWFTPYTLAKVLTRSGFHPGAFEFVAHERSRPLGIRSWLRHLVLQRYPIFRQTLIMRAAWDRP